MKQRNNLIQHPDEEFDDFIRVQLDNLQGVHSNFEKPTGKQLTEIRKHGKALIELVKTWCKLKKTIDENTCIETIGAIEEYSFGTPKPSAKYATNHKNILKLGSKYVELKKKYISKF